jgi:hypothetical protein
MGAMQGEQGLFIVTQNDHYNAPQNVWFYSNGVRKEGENETYLATVADQGVTITAAYSLTKPGFFLGLWKRGGFIDGWTLVTEFSYFRNELPWFGNASGTEFVCGNGDVLTVDGVLTRRVNKAGAWRESVSPPWNSVVNMLMEANYDGKEHFEYLVDNLLFTDVSLRFTAFCGLSATKTVVETYREPKQLMLTQVPAPLTLVGSDTLNGSHYAFGGQQPYEWDFPTGCGMGKITVTDACGATASKMVRMPIGSWLNYETYDRPGGGLVEKYLAQELDDTRITMSVDSRTNILLASCMAWSPIQEKCTTTTNCQYDNGFPASFMPPLFGDSIATSTTFTDSRGCRPSYTIYTYWTVITVQ